VRIDDSAYRVQDRALAQATGAGGDVDRPRHGAPASPGRGAAEHNNGHHHHHHHHQRHSPRRGADDQRYSPRRLHKGDESPHHPHRVGIAEDQARRADGKREEDDGGNDNGGEGDDDDEDDEVEEEEEDQADAVSEMVWGVASSLIGITVSMFAGQQKRGGDAKGNKAGKGKVGSPRRAVRTASSSSSSSASSAESETPDDEDDEDEDRAFDRRLQAKLAAKAAAAPPPPSRFGWMWGGGSAARSGNGSSGEGGGSGKSTGSAGDVAASDSWSTMAAPPTDSELRQRGLGMAPPVIVAADITRAEDSVRSGLTPRKAHPAPPADVSIALAVAKHQVTPRSNGPPPTFPPAPNGYSMTNLPRGVNWRYVDVLNNAGTSGNEQ